MYFTCLLSKINWVFLVSEFLILSIYYLLILKRKERCSLMCYLERWYRKTSYIFYILYVGRYSILLRWTGVQAFGGNGCCGDITSFGWQVEHPTSWATAPCVLKLGVLLVNYTYRTNPRLSANSRPNMDKQSLIYYPPQQARMHSCLSLGQREAAWEISTAV